MQSGESHALYNHPVFAQSSKWLLSTSALLSGDSLQGTGFGCVYPDGYGMNYMISTNKIKIGVESKKSCDATDSKKYLKEYVGALEDLKEMCIAVNGVLGLAKL
jgi:carnitine O-acetyltransferase